MKHASLLVRRNMGCWWMAKVKVLESRSARNNGAASPFTGENKNIKTREAFFFFYPLTGSRPWLRRSQTHLITSQSQRPGLRWPSDICCPVPFLPRKAAHWSRLQSTPLSPGVFGRKNNSRGCRRRQRSRPRVSDVFVLLRWNGVRTDSNSLMKVSVFSLLA